MNFKLAFDFPSISEPINYSDEIFLIGSCFAENIHYKLKHYKFQSYCNPAGILFNPLSIATCLNNIVNSIAITKDQIFEHQGVWYSWQHHGSIAAASEVELAQMIDHENNLAFTKLSKAKFLIITLGSAYIYELIQGNLLVANCHKIQASNFNKKLLGIEEISLAFETMINGLKKINPTIQILFTISPVRYIRDGLNQNNLSKATLHLAVQKILKQHQNCYYFPAYEIVIDELRDYRFFERDFMHPNQLAIDYVWQRFTETCFDKKTAIYLEDLNPILTAKNHRILHQKSNTHLQFKKTMYEKCMQFLTKYPAIDLNEELNYFVN